MDVVTPSIQWRVCGEKREEGEREREREKERGM
jgi:hypothetical protein